MFRARTRRPMALTAEGEFEWRQEKQTNGTAAAFRVLKEGYLNVNSNVDTEQLEAEKMGKSGLGLRKSFSRNWKKRWCTLSQTRDNGTSLLYYKHQSSPGSIDAPVGVLLMDGGCKVYPVPAHPKSSGVFAIEVPQRITLFYADKEADTEQWLDVLKVTSLTPGEARISTASLSVRPTGDGDRPKRKKPLTVSLSSPG
ncbi:hypothetical protein EMCRGX_G000689 [Ephydatia muelleri]